MFLHIFVTVPLCLAPQATAPSMPEALVNLQRARAELRTGRVDCVVFGGPWVTGMTEHRFGLQMAKNGDRIHTYGGDLEGAFARDVYGYPLVVGGAATLLTRDGYFHKMGSDPSATIMMPSAYDHEHVPYTYATQIDLRAVGMAPSWGSFENQSVDSVLPNVMKGCVGYSAEREGSVHRVTADFRDTRQIVYEIDESKGWNATRITGVDDRGRRWECAIDLRENQGMWFPEVVSLSYEGEDPCTQWVVTEAAFNSTGDPKSFSPADIGFEVGTPTSIAKHWTHQDSTHGLWDGQKVAPRDEVMRRINAGELEPGPRLKLVRSLQPGDEIRTPYDEVLTRLQTSRKVLECFISAWEVYVAEFIVRHALNADQREQAWRCLRKGQERANQWLDRHRTKFEELAKKRGAGSLSSKQLQEEFGKLRNPVDDIFDTDVRPCVEKIPTREQKVYAGEWKKKFEERYGPYRDPFERPQREAVERREEPAQPAASQPVRPSPP